MIAHSIELRRFAPNILSQMVELFKIRFVTAECYKNLISSVSRFSRVLISGQCESNKKKIRKMKFVIFLLALVTLTRANPIEPFGINDNKIGDIITANVDVNLVLSTNTEQNIVTLIAALLNQQAAVVGGDLPAPAVAGEAQQAPAMSDITKLLTPENIEKFKNVIATLAKNQNQE